MGKNVTIRIHPDGSNVYIGSTLFPSGGYISGTSTLSNDVTVYGAMNWIASFDPSLSGSARTVRDSILSGLSNGLVPTRSGYIFEGWSVKGGNNYNFSTNTSNRDRIFGNANGPADGSYVICPYWRQDTSSKVTVTYYYNSTSQNIDNTSGGRYLTPSQPTSPGSGYTFEGWCTNSSGTGNYILADSIVPNLGTKFWAIWKAPDIGPPQPPPDPPPAPVITYHTVSYNSNGGTSINSQSVADGNPAPTPSPTKQGYTFSHWLLNNVKYNGAGIYTDVTLEAVYQKVYSAPTISLLNKDTVYYAARDKISYTVSIPYTANTGDSGSKVYCNVGNGFVLVDGSGDYSGYVTLGYGSWSHIPSTQNEFTVQLKRILSTESGDLSSSTVSFTVRFYKKATVSIDNVTVNNQVGPKISKAKCTLTVSYGRNAGCQVSNETSLFFRIGSDWRIVSSGSDNGGTFTISSAVLSSILENTSTLRLRRDHRYDNPSCDSAVVTYPKTFEFYQKATLSISLPDKRVTKNNSSITVPYSKNDSPDQTLLYYCITDSESAPAKGTNSPWIQVETDGNLSGTITIPSDVLKNYQNKNLKLYMYRKHTYDDSCDSDVVSSKWMFNKIIPELPTNCSISRSLDPINADTNLTLSYTGFPQSPVATLNPYDKYVLTWCIPQYKLYVNDGYYNTVSSTTHTITKLDGINNITYSKDRSRINLSYRAYYSNYDDAEYTSPEYSTSTVVLYRPTTPIMNLIPSNGINYLSKYNSPNAPNHKNMTWSYPDTSHSGYNSNGQNGIVDGYDINVYNEVTNQLVKTFSIIGKSTTIQDVTVNDIEPLDTHLIIIRPYYNKTSPEKMYGQPVSKINYFKRISKLEKSTILYPITGKTWYNNSSFKVCVDPSQDPDFNEMSIDNKQNYRYGDIEVSINNKTSTILNNPDAFSTLLENIREKSYLDGKGIIFDPSKDADLYNINDSILTLRVRVKNKYVPSNFSDMLWSDWSDSICIQNINSLPLINTKKDQYILAEHVDTVYKVVKNVVSTYDCTIKDATYESGKLITADDYNDLNRALVNVVDIVNDYCYRWDNLDCKFPDLEDHLARDIIIAGSDNAQTCNSNPNNYIQKVLRYVMMLVALDTKFS